MSETFLSKVAEYINARFPEDQIDLCIVFSNRRAKLFFQKELNKINSATQWLPEIYSMEDFVQRATSLEITDRIDQLFDLFEVYREIEGTEAETFEQFSNWAAQLLNDFSEIDLHKVEAGKLFSYINEAYAISHWTPENTPISENQKKYLRFWSRIALWYDAFRKKLQQKNKATSAMAFRELADRMKNQQADLPWKHIIFAGLNALNKSEKEFIKALEKAGKATLLWDADAYYVDNEFNEAGYFIRQFIKENGQMPFLTKETLIQNSRKQIQITGVAKNIGQSFVAGGILRDLIESGADLSNTALVLCDENLLVPVMEAIPTQVNKINITMGYPIHLLPESNLFVLLFDFHAHMRMVKYREQDEPSWYHRDVIRLLRNPVFSSLIDSAASEKLIYTIKKESHIFVKATLLREKNEQGISLFEHLDFLIDPWEEKAEKAIECFKILIEKLRDAHKEDGNESSDIRLESLFIISGIIKRIKKFNETHSGFDSVKTFQRLFQQLIKQETLPFYGEPLDGLQVMGLLETRNLDFKNLIMLSVNEGILPAARSHNSLIPQDIRHHFGLPVYRDRDAVFAYHFYRLLQRAENIWLLYNTENDEFGKGEQSRFISQISEELNHPDISITKNLWFPSLQEARIPEIRVTKTPQLIRELKEQYGKGEKAKYLSPTSISTYLRCSLQFYYRYVKRIKTEKTVEDDIGADVMGIVVHNVLQDLYTPLKGKSISREDIQQMSAGMEDKIRLEFLKHLSEEDLDHGKNLLVYKGAENMLRNFLIQEERKLSELEIEDKKIELLELEFPLAGSLKLEDHDGLFEIMLGGKADRIDRLDDQVRIIDYKTGTINPKDFEMGKLEDFQADANKSKLIQLMQYALMAKSSFNTQHYFPGILSLLKPSLGFIELKTEKIAGFDQEKLEIIELIFRNIVQEIFDSEADFEQTEDLKICEWCDFRQICNR